MSVPPVPFPTPKQSSLVSATCRVTGHTLFPFPPFIIVQDTPLTTMLWCWGAGLWPQNCSVLWPATSTSTTLLCLLACIFTVNTQDKDCPPGSFSAQMLAPQDLSTILYSYWTWGNTSSTVWPQTLAQFAQGGCGVFHLWKYSEAGWRWSQAISCRWSC